MSLSIGQLSAETGCNIETIRYYERIRLMNQARRSSGNHRIYGEPDRRRLVFIRRCRELGFPVDDIRDLLRLVDGGAPTCAEVKSVTENHLAGVRRRITDLRKMETVLKGLVRECSGETIPDCPIIDTLFKQSSIR